MADSPVMTDIILVQGETKVFSATWTVGGVAKSLTGYVAHLQLRKRPGKFNTPPLLDLASTGPTPALTVEPDDVVGKVKVRIAAQLTATVTKNCWYSLFLVNASDPTEAVRLMDGEVIVSLSSTDNSTLDLIIDTPDPGGP